MPSYLPSSASSASSQLTKTKHKPSKATSQIIPTGMDIDMDKNYHPSLTLPSVLYTAMGTSLLERPEAIKPKPVKFTPPIKATEKPDGNYFYSASRYHSNPPSMPSVKKCTCKMMCGTLGAPVNVARFKCYSCVKFERISGKDDGEGKEGKGYFCSACFTKCHPYYREAHNFIDIEDDDDIEFDLLEQIYNNSITSTVNGVEGLMDVVKVVIDDCNKDFDVDEDNEVNDKMKRKEKTLDVCSRKIWEMKHMLRTGLLRDSESIVVKELESDDVKSGVLESVPYTTQGGLSPYAKSLHGEQSQSRKFNSRLTDLDAVIMIQSLARLVIARNRVLVKVSLNYQKVYSKKYKQFYFINTRKKLPREGGGGGGAKTTDTQWSYPPNVDASNLEVVMTPRSFVTVFGSSDCADLEVGFSSSSSSVSSSTSSTPSSGAPSTLEGTNLAIVPIGATKVIKSLRKNNKIMNERCSRMAKRLDVIQTRRSHNAASNGKSRRLDNNQFQRSLTQETACVKVQSCIRLWLARIELGARAEVLILHVKPSNNARPFYFNMRTLKSTYQKPRVFSNRVTETLTVEEARNRTKRYKSRVKKKVFDVNLTYPVSRESKENVAIIYLQNCVRRHQSRARMREKWDERWDTEFDVDTGLNYYYNNVLGVSVWEKPWSVDDVSVKVGGR